MRWVGRPRDVDRRALGLVGPRREGAAGDSTLPGASDRGPNVRPEAWRNGHVGGRVRLGQVHSSIGWGLMVAARAPGLRALPHVGCVVRMLTTVNGTRASTPFPLCVQGSTQGIGESL